MKQEHTGRDELGGEDARFVERLRTHYAPPPRTAAQRAAFDARLAQRLERRSWHWALAPALAGASLAALLTWSALPQAGSNSGDAEVTARAPGASSFERVILYGDPVETTTSGAWQDEALPPEYAAIDSAFFEG
jgi:hypothetical protein